MKLLLGAGFYWLIGGFFTRRPRLLSREQMEREEPIVETAGLQGGFEYSDAYLHDNDARFVWGFVRSALDRGCVAANYVEGLGATPAAGGWVTRARDQISGRELPIRSRLLINACGPWADEVNARDGVATAHRHVFSKGIHILVDRLTEHRRVLTFFADDGRLFFVIPMGPKTCIGTTDTRVDRPEVAVTAEDRRFVLDNINKRLRLPRPLNEEDIIAERCGVRPLAVQGAGSGGRDWMQLSRKHAIETDAERGHVTIFGGKLSDCLNVGEETCREVRRLGVELPYPEKRWYGEPPAPVREEYFHQARLMELDSLTSKQSSEELSTRLWRRYGRHPPRPAAGGGDHRDQRVHPLRAGRGDAARDGGEAGGLPPAALEDRAGGAARGHLARGRAARGVQDLLRRRGGGAHRRVLSREGRGSEDRMRKVLFAILAMIVLLLVGNALLPRRIHIESSRATGAQSKNLYPLLANLKDGWPKWSPFGKAHDPDLQETFSGPETGVGATESWTGGSTPPGHLTLTRADPDSGVDFRIEMAGGVSVLGRITLAPQGNGTLVSWSDDVNLGDGFFAGWSGVIIRFLLARSIGTGLTRLDGAWKTQIKI